MPLIILQILAIVAIIALLEDLFDITKLNQVAPAKGRVLISEPFMEDNFFKRSVVYLCEYNEDGAFGFVLNNILTIGISDLIDDFDAPDFEVGFGGPVNSSNLYYLHTVGDLVEDSYLVVEGLYTGGDFEKLRTLICTGLVAPEQARFFMGYSGWTAGQLEQEIADNAWIVGELNDINVITSTDRSLWKNLLDEMGGKFKIISNFPEDPSLN